MCFVLLRQLCIANVMWSKVEIAVQLSDEAASLRLFANVTVTVSHGTSISHQ